MADKGSFPFISFFDVKVIVTPLEVNLHEVMGACEFVDKLRDEGKWIVVLHNMLVWVVVILVSILLQQEECWAHFFGFGWFYITIGVLFVGEL